MMKTITLRKDESVPKQTVELADIRDIGRKIGLEEKDLILYGTKKAKIKFDCLDDTKKKNRGKLVLVTATTPTPFGEGKTTVSIGLSMGFWKLGKRSITALREPSLGPVFGIKGGATGGGKTMVQPMEDINLHFTGDFHSVTSAHNLLSAMTDASIFNRNPLGLDRAQIFWPRTIDMNDRSLRRIIIGLEAHKSGPMREDGFVITPASEVMAILGLARSYKDLHKRLGNILVGLTPDKKPVFARDLMADGAMTALLKDALLPNLVQTTEQTPAIIHTGPFGNIAHGTCSLTAIEASVRLSDIAVIEAGFGSDLGAEKFMNIVSPHLGFSPDAAVLVTTVRALKFHGGMKKDELETENITALEKGFDNLRSHKRILTDVFGLPTVVAVNRFPFDTENELNNLCRLIEAEHIDFALSEGFLNGSDGSIELAQKVTKVLEQDRAMQKPVYDPKMSSVEKIDLIARKVYQAGEVEYSRKAMRTLDMFDGLGFGNLYICMAKTQYSLSDQTALKGNPRGFKLRIDDVRLKAGAGFIVPLCGDILEMPGLPKEPAARNVNITDEGVITGLF
jgi:formate--tetrahydrofolate ligase